jgi:hypothetical protein
VRLKRWMATLALASALSILLAPALVLLVGLIIRGALRDPGTSVLGFVGVLFLFGVVQFGLFFLVVGLITGWLSALSASRGLALRVAAIFVPTVLFPVAAVGAIVWSNLGYVPLIQDTRPYFIGGFPAGLVVGVLTLLFALRIASKQSIAKASA